MSGNNPASTIIFDVNETLLDISTLEPLFDRLFGRTCVLREWFAELILYSQTMALSGLYTTFGDLAVGSLRMVASNNDVRIEDDDIVELKDRLGNMPAYPDVIPALTRLREAGFRLVTLTNSANTTLPSPLQKAGIDLFFEQSFSVDAVRKFKPAPETYRYVAQEMGVEMSDMCLVACHLWDTIGAQSAGCYGAFIARPHNAILPARNIPIPDFIASDLTQLADQIISRWTTNL